MSYLQPCIRPCELVWSKSTIVVLYDKGDAEDIILYNV